MTDLFKNELGFPKARLNYPWRVSVTMTLCHILSFWTAADYLTDRRTGLVSAFSVCQVCSCPRGPRASLLGPPVPITKTMGCVGGISCLWPQCEEFKERPTLLTSVQNAHYLILGTGEVLTWRAVTSPHLCGEVQGISCFSQVSIVQWHTLMSWANWVEGVLAGQAGCALCWPCMVSAAQTLLLCKPLPSGPSWPAHVAACGPAHAVIGQLLRALVVSGLHLWWGPGWSDQAVASCTSSWGTTGSGTPPGCTPLSLWVVRLEDDPVLPPDVCPVVQGYTLNLGTTGMQIEILDLCLE